MFLCSSFHRKNINDFTWSYAFFQFEHCSVFSFDLDSPHSKTPLSTPHSTIPQTTILHNSPHLNSPLLRPHFTPPQLSSPGLPHTRTTHISTPIRPNSLHYNSPDNPPVQLPTPTPHTATPHNITPHFTKPHSPTPHNKSQTTIRHSTNTHTRTPRPNSKHFNSPHPNCPTSTPHTPARHAQTPVM